MRDQRNIHVGKGDALLHLQTGIEYEVQLADDETGKFEFIMRGQIVRGPGARRDGEIPLQGFLKIPRLNEEVENEARAKAVIDSVRESIVGNKLRQLKKAVGL